MVRDKNRETETEGRASTESFLRDDLQLRAIYERICREREVPAYSQNFYTGQSNRP